MTLRLSLFMAGILSALAASQLRTEALKLYDAPIAILRAVTEGME